MCIRMWSFRKWVSLNSVEITERAN
jgi:hypothetical protein